MLKNNTNTNPNDKYLGSMISIEKLSIRAKAFKSLTSMPSQRISSFPTAFVSRRRKTNGGWLAAVTKNRWPENPFFNLVGNKST